MYLFNYAELPFNQNVNSECRPCGKEMSAGFSSGKSCRGDESNLLGKQHKCQDILKGPFHRIQMFYIYHSPALLNIVMKFPPLFTIGLQIAQYYSRGVYFVSHLQNKYNKIAYVTTIARLGRNKKIFLSTDVQCIKFLFVKESL